MKIKAIHLSLILLSLQQQTAGQELSRSLQRTSSPLTYAQQDVIDSEILGEQRRFNILLPESFHTASDTHTYPVLILLEDEFFHMVSGVVKHLSSVERMPETIVVSILDMSYMPTIYTNGSSFWPGEKLADEDPALFTKHLREELFPYLQAHYRANDFRMIMGLSPTSVYALHAFVKEADLFDAHIAIAAGDMLGMGYEAGERFIDLLASEVKNFPDKKRYLYVTSADADAGSQWPEIKPNLEELERVLGPYRSENFSFISKVFPNEGHYDVALPALLEALALVFPQHEWSARYRDIVNQAGNAMANLDAYYRELSKQYGFSILPRAERWNSINRLSWVGPYLLRQGRPAEGIEVIERWAAYRPKSTAALDELSRAYEASGELEKALGAMSKAHELAKTSGSEDAQPYLERLEELKIKIGDKQ